MSGEDASAEPRYELKLVCEERAREAVLAILWQQPAGIRRLHPPRRVHSLYLDTHAGRAVADSLAGISEREKIRLRWYGCETRGVHGVLEKKQRRRRLGTKQNLALPEALDVAGATRRDLVQAILRQCPPAWRHVLGQGIEPVQWVHYEREYLASADRAVRITVDSRLRAFDQRHRCRLGCKRPTPTPRILVVELKAPRSQRARLEDLVQVVPLVVGRCSKLVLASSSAHGPIVSELGW